MCRRRWLYLLESDRPVSAEVGKTSTISRAGLVVTRVRRRMTASKAAAGEARRRRGAAMLVQHALGDKLGDSKDIGQEIEG